MIQDAKIGIHVVYPEIQLDEMLKTRLENVACKFTLNNENEEIFEKAMPFDIKLLKHVFDVLCYAENDEHFGYKIKIVEYISPKGNKTSDMLLKHEITGAMYIISGKTYVR